MTIIVWPVQLIMFNICITCKVIQLTSRYTASANLSNLAQVYMPTTLIFFYLTSDGRNLVCDVTIHLKTDL